MSNILKGLLKEGKMHISPSGVETDMDPKDDDYEINYGKNGAVAKFRKANNLDIKTGEKKVKEGVGQKTTVTDYGQWRDQIESLGGTVYPQKDRVRLVAQSWDGEIIGEFNLRSNEGYINKEGVAEGLNEFAPDGFNGGDDDEEFSPEIAKMAQEDGFTKGVSLADGATLERAMKINYWHSQHGGIYKQYFAKGFKAGRMNKVKHDNRQYNLNLKLMKDGSIRHGEQDVVEGSPPPGSPAWQDGYRAGIKDTTNKKPVGSYAYCDGWKAAKKHLSDKQKQQGVAEGSLVDKQVAYWDSVAKDKKNKERETLKAKKEKHEQTPTGKAEKYWSKKGVAEESGQDKLHARHQEIRKEKGLPDPKYYIELKKIYSQNLPDQEHSQAITALKQKYNIKEDKCPHCGGPLFEETMMNEKKDACYYKVKSRYKVWPSAYASGALVKCRKKGAKNWGNKSESIQEDDELYGLKVGDTVRTEINGEEVQGDIIDIFPESMEIELLLRGPNSGKTVTVDVRDTEALSEDQLDELKCWPGYTRVRGVPAGAPGSCKKKTSESSILEGLLESEQLDENLRKWFKEKWVRFGPDGKIRGSCARGDDSEGKPKCLPQAKAHALGKKGRKYAASKKRREDPNPERRGPAKNVATKKKTKESVIENTAAGISNMFNNMFDPKFAALQRVALLAMQGRQDEAKSHLLRAIKDSNPDIQKKIIDAVDRIKPVTINSKVADSSTLSKSEQHNKWIVEKFIPWVESAMKEGLNEFLDDRDGDGSGEDPDSFPLTEFADIIQQYLGRGYTRQDREKPEQVSVKFEPKDKTRNGAILYSVVGKRGEYPTVNIHLLDYEQGFGRGRKAGVAISKTRDNALKLAELIFNAQLEEGWKSKVAGTALGLAALGGIGKVIQDNPNVTIDGTTYAKAISMPDPQRAKELKVQTDKNGNKIYTFYYKAKRGYRPYYYPAEKEQVKEFLDDRKDDDGEEPDDAWIQRKAKLILDYVQKHDGPFRDPEIAYSFRTNTFRFTGKHPNFDQEYEYRYVYHPGDPKKGIKPRWVPHDAMITDQPYPNDNFTPVTFDSDIYEQGVDEGQIYSGGNKPAGLRWYKPRSVANQSELNKESAIMKGLQLEGNDEEHFTGGSLGTPYPSTYEQETLPYRTKGQRRTQAIAFEDEQLDEKWSEKYKRSIDCSHPKGFSQRAHCQGRKKHKE